MLTGAISVPDLPMFDFIRRWNRSQQAEPYVRPWGLATPVLVLVTCLPLLRPLLHPTGISDNERERLATIQAIVEHRSLVITDSTFFPSTSAKRPDAAHRAARQVRSTQPPVLAAILAGPYWLMHRLGLTFSANQALAAYLLTLLGVTLPVCGAAAVIYRLGRLLELDRPWRMGLAFVCIFASGLISYATVLNSHAPAAALLMAATAAIFHGAMTRHQHRGVAWVGVAGFLAALGAVIDLGALVYLVLLPLVVLALRWTIAAKLVALACYIVGAAPPVALHAALTVPVTGDLRPGMLTENVSRVVVHSAPKAAIDDTDDDEQPDALAVALVRAVDGAAGAHGLLSHFPALCLGLAGIWAVLRGHWPVATKALATVTIVGAAAVVGIYAAAGADWDQPMFAARWFIVFTPLLMFWAGAWLRRGHKAWAWTAAACVVGFSVMAGLAGAAAPFTRAAAGQYTLAAAVRDIFAKPAQPLRHSATMPHAGGSDAAGSSPARPRR